MKIIAQEQKNSPSNETFQSILDRIFQICKLEEKKNQTQSTTDIKLDDLSTKLQKQNELLNQSTEIYQQLIEKRNKLDLEIVGLKTIIFENIGIQGRL